MLNSKYGYFDKKGKEFVITNPYTPRPWINVISNGDYSLIVSQMGGGFSFRDNAEQNRLTRLFQDIVKDNWGKYFYIRDLETKDYFSATLKPVMTPCDKYEVRHGMGYTTFIRENFGIRSEMTIFVSSDSPMEFIKFKITNLLNKKRKLDITSYFEWAPGIAYDNHREFQRLFSTLSFDSKNNAIKISKCLWGFPDKNGVYNNDNWPFTGFFATSLKVSSYETDKEQFLGMYNDEKNPDALKNKELKNSDGRFGDPCSALRSKINLKENESIEFTYTLGMAKFEEEKVDELIKKTTVAKANEELTKVGKFWDNLLDKDIVETGDDEFDVFTNIWSKYQSISCRLWAKAAYYQISGGIGYRDQLQDSLVFLQSNPELTKKQILLHATKQFKEGDVFHWWLTINPWGPRGHCSDDFLWLPFATIEYIKETKDFEILNTVLPFANGDEATLYEHLIRAFKHSFEMTSPRGIPLMGDHDWNDGLSAVGHQMKGESFWVAEFLYKILDEFDPLMEYVKDDTNKTLIHTKKVNLKEAFNKYAWDGKYYLQATNDLGELVGSHTNKEGKVFLNPQLWAVISNICDKEHQITAMKAVSKHLLKDYGALLLAPAYCNPNPNIGYVTRYAPGLRENGGVYTHAATWATWAYSLIGDNDLAYESYIRICPIHRRKDIDSFKSEPYVTPGNSDGPLSPYYGKGGWSWYSGSSQWMHNVALNCIIGVRATFEGLEIKPCIPNKWKGYTYTRIYLRKEVKIICKRTGKESITVNGVVKTGNIINLDDAPSKVLINVEIK